MESVNTKKPINVLTEFLADWIRTNSEEAVPFDSFEVLSGRKAEQKDVERWIFNCNYLYYRLGDFLLDKGLIPYEEDTAKAVILNLDTCFKTIKDSNPLNLRSKQEDAILKEFSKDWPPLADKSRNTFEKSSEALEAFKNDCLITQGASIKQFDQFSKEIKKEESFYRGLVKGGDNTPGLLVERYKTLLPIWCIKEINPLFTLLIWNDEEAIAELSMLLKESFESNGYPSVDGGYRHDSYVGIVANAQRVYLDTIDSDDCELKEKSVGELARLLDSSFFSLDYPCASDKVPAWLFGKAQLIWDIVVCSILGPKEAIGGLSHVRTKTEIHSKARHADEENDELFGEVILRRHYREKGPEMVGRISLDDVAVSGLWKVLGSSYDKNAALPKSKFKDDYSDLTGLYISTRVLDSSGDLLEGDGDSRYHAELSVSVEESGSRSIVLRDLGSKNGTYVMRKIDGTVFYRLLRSRLTDSCDEWALNHDVDAKHVELVDRLNLRRGDLIHLCDSCFEIF